MGVCCDHVNLTKTQQLLTLDDIRNTESRLSVRFQADHLAFLLNHNGGEPWPRKVVFRSGSDEEGWAYDDLHIGEFSFLPGPQETSQVRGQSIDVMFDDLRYMESLVEEQPEVTVADRYLPIASWSYSGYLLMPNWHDRPSAVWSVWTEESMELIRLVPSLPQLLGRIIVE